MTKLKITLKELLQITHSKIASEKGFTKLDPEDIEVTDVTDLEDKNELLQKALNVLEHVKQYTSCLEENFAIVNDDLITEVRLIIEALKEKT